LIHNPIENKAVGSIDVKKLDRLYQRKSIVKNKGYPGKLLFCKKWTENKIFCIDE